MNHSLPIVRYRCEESVAGTTVVIDCSLFDAAVLCRSCHDAEHRRRKERFP
jgi:hypothetical protein